MGPDKKLAASITLSPDSGATRVPLHIDVKAA